MQEWLLFWSLTLPCPVGHIAELWKMLTTHHSDEVQNLINLCQVALVLPTNTAGYERGFSAQNRIKNALRNWLKAEGLDVLMTIDIEGPPSKDFSTALDVINNGFIPDFPDNVIIPCHLTRKTRDNPLEECDKLWLPWRFAGCQRSYPTEIKPGNRNTLEDMQFDETNLSFKESEIQVPLYNILFKTY